MSDSDDYYKILGISRDATEKEIKRAYRKLALKWHPDKNPDNKEKAEARFKVIGEAYQVLSDPKQKQTYDRFGKAGLKGGPGGATFIDPNELFATLFGGGGPFGGGGGGGFPGGMHFSFGGPGGGGGMPFGMGGMGGMRGGPFGGMGGGGFPGGRGRPQQRREVTKPVLSDGTKVVIRNLKKASVHNQKKGVIESYDDPRYVVELEDGNKLKVKVANLMQRLPVIIVDPGSEKLNGKEAFIVDFKDEQGLYFVEVPSDTRSGFYALPPAKTRFSEKVRVRVKGLVKAKQWNGHWGEIEEFIEEKGRYRIRILAKKDGGIWPDGRPEQKLVLKPENLLP